MKAPAPWEYWRTGPDYAWGRSATVANIKDAVANDHVFSVGRRFFESAGTYQLSSGAVKPEVCYDTGYKFTFRGGIRKQRSDGTDRSWLRTKNYIEVHFHARKKGGPQDVAHVWRGKHDHRGRIYGDDAEALYVWITGLKAPAARQNYNYNRKKLSYAQIENDIQN